MSTSDEKHISRCDKIKLGTKKEYFRDQKKNPEVLSDHLIEPT